MNEPTPKSDELLPTKPEEPNKGTAASAVWDFVKFATIAVIIVIPVRLFIAQPFIVSGASMVPTFQSGHYLIIDELSYRFNEPRRGDVIVFRFPQEPNMFLIKRVVGLPRETVKIEGNDITIQNDAHPLGFTWQQGDIAKSRGTAEQTFTLEDDEFLVLGDNRGESADSRIWGPLKRKYIVGRPLIRLLPVSKLDVFPGRWQHDTNDTDEQIE